MVPRKQIQLPIMWGVAGVAALQATPSATFRSCANPNQRFRRSWYQLSEVDKDIYLDSLHISMQRGFYQRFLRYHVDAASSILAHDTCAFALWHRRFLWGFETMLRDVTKNTCIAIPFWNVMDDHRAQDEQKCISFLSCSGYLLQKLGGPASLSITASRSYENVTADGSVFRGFPYSDVESWENDRRIGVVRGEFLDFDPVPASCRWESVTKQIMEETSGSVYARLMQRSIHDDVHDAIGGFMPTNASPVDILFWQWHSLIDLLLLSHQLCHVVTGVNETDTDTVDPTEVFPIDNSCHQSDRSRQMFPNLTISTELYMRSGAHDIRDDPIIGKYFQSNMTYASIADGRQDIEGGVFSYAIPLELQRMLAEDCPQAASFTVPPTLAPDIAVTTTSLSSSSSSQPPLYWRNEVEDRLTSFYAADPSQVPLRMALYDCLSALYPNLITTIPAVLDFVTGAFDDHSPEQCSLTTTIMPDSSPPTPSNNLLTASPLDDAMNADVQDENNGAAFESSGAEHHYYCHRQFTAWSLSIALCLLSWLGRDR